MANTFSRTALVTGSSGLIGSEVVDYFCRLGWSVHGMDNNMRADFFGPGGDTRWNQRRLIIIVLVATWRLPHFAFPGISTRLLRVLADIT